MTTSNLVYLLIQSVHNLGGALTLGLALLLVWEVLERTGAKRILWLLLIVWGGQGATGLCFALSSLYFYGSVPDIHSIAIVAMGVKVACVATAVSYCAWLLYTKLHYLGRGAGTIFLMLTCIAQVAAAVLRWTS